MPVEQDALLGGHGSVQRQEQHGYGGSSAVSAFSIRSSASTSTVLENEVGMEGGKDDYPPQPLRARAGPFAKSLFNLMNAVMGSGILGLSYAMGQSGVVVFPILLLLMAVLSDFTLHLLLSACDTAGVATYEGLGEVAFGKPGKLFTGATIILQNTGAITTYLQIIGDSLPPLLAAALGEKTDALPWYLERDVMILCAFVVLMLPLLVLRRINFLGYFSGVSIALVFAFAAYALVKFFELSCDDAALCQLNEYTLTVNAPFVLPTLCFSFVCHTTVLPVYAEMNDQGKRDMSPVVHSAMIVCWGLYLAAATLGYLTFRSLIEADLLKNYLAVLVHDPVTITIAIAMVFAFCLTVPLINFPARKALILMLGYEFEDHPLWLHGVLTAVFSGVYLCLAIFVPSIKYAFGFAGATSAVLLVCVFPALYFVRINPAPLRSLRKVTAIAIGCIGVCIGVISIVGEIRELAMK
jgi:solute carrier family 38 (sodium-coupled neutral amino acid transporter), member 6